MMLAISESKDERRRDLANGLKVAFSFGVKHFDAGPTANFKFSCLKLLAPKRNAPPI